MGEQETPTIGPLGVAVVGAGYWGPNLIRNFRGCSETHLRWIIDRDLPRAEALRAQFSDEQVSTSIDDALADPEVHAIAVATPPGSHLALGLAAIEAGKHLLMEKPLATSVAEGEQLVAAAEQHGVKIMCDHTFCFTPVVREIRELIHSGKLGDIHYIDSIRVNLGLIQSDVDVFWDLAPHDLSIFDFVLPDGVSPIAVSACGADPIGAGQNCVGYLTMPLSSGAIAHVSVNWMSPTKIRQTVIAGSRRMVVWDDMKPYQRLSVVDCGVDLRHLAVGEEKEKLMVDYRMGDMVIPALTETSEALHAMVLELVASIREDRPPLTDGLSGLRVLRILEAAHESLDNNSAMIPIDMEMTRR